MTFVRTIFLLTCFLSVLLSVFSENFASWRRFFVYRPNVVWLSAIQVHRDRRTISITRSSRFRQSSVYISVAYSVWSVPNRNVRNSRKKIVRESLKRTVTGKKTVKSPTVILKTDFIYSRRTSRFLILFPLKSHAPPIIIWEG